MTTSICTRNESEGVRRVKEYESMRTSMSQCESYSKSTTMSQIAKESRRRSHQRYRHIESIRVV